MSRKSKSTLTRKQQRALNRFIGWLIISALVIWGLIYVIQNYGIYILIAIIIILILVILWIVMKFLRKRKLKSEIGDILKKALEAMDDTAKTYTDEEEANKELVVYLKGQGLNAVRPFRLSDGRLADAKVDNFLLEGKLAPTIDEVDRLIGQIQAYTKHPYCVNIVIYGHLAKKSLKRIEDEIIERYPKKVFLSYLENPKRKRAC